MAAPSKSNLINFNRKNANAAGGAGRGRSQALRDPLAEPDVDVSASNERINRAQNDAIVQSTDTDANISRLSAVQAGYLYDPFAQDFAPAGEVAKRFPIINRGTYARTTAIDRLVADFIQSPSPSQRQIVSLGAGSDTRYFRMMHQAREAAFTAANASFKEGMPMPSVAFPPNILYHELDFAVNTKSKITAIMETPRLKGLVGDPVVVRWREAELHGPHYHIHACDLRDLDVSRPWNTGKPPHINHLDPSLPTLLISECCLTYLAPNEADAVVRYFAAKALAPSAPLGLVLYEPIHPFDSFGKVMVANLAKRGIALQTIRTYHSLQTQRERLRAYGLTAGQRAVDVDFLLDNWIDERERKRINRVEMLDEVEELNLLAKHYCIAWGWRDGEDPKVWERWKTLVEEEEAHR